RNTALQDLDFLRQRIQLAPDLVELRPNVRVGRGRQGVQPRLELGELFFELSGLLRGLLGEGRAGGQKEKRQNEGLHETLLPEERADRRGKARLEANENVSPFRTRKRAAMPRRSAKASPSRGPITKRAVERASARRPVSARTGT